MPEGETGETTHHRTRPITSEGGPSLGELSAKLEGKPVILGEIPSLDRIRARLREAAEADPKLREQALDAWGAVFGVVSDRDPEAIRRYLFSDSKDGDGDREVEFARHALRAVNEAIKNTTTPALVDTIGRFIGRALTHYAPGEGDPKPQTPDEGK